MENVVDLASHPARASARKGRGKGTKPTNILADRPFLRPIELPITEGHQPTGILSRCHHLRTAGRLSPMSEANASCESQRPMTSLKDVIFDMPVSIGQFVPKIKAIVSTDRKDQIGHAVPMEDDHEKLA